jgi:hypothetical protein
MQVLGAPDGERANDGPQVETPFAQRVLGSRRVLGIEPALDDVMLLEELEPVRQDPRRDTRQRIQQVVELFWSREEIPHDQKGPPLSEELQRLRDRTRLVVVFRHTASIPLRNNFVVATNSVAPAVLAHRSDRVYVRLAPAVIDYRASVRRPRIPIVLAAAGPPGSPARGPQRGLPRWGGARVLQRDGVALVDPGYRECLSAFRERPGQWGPQHAFFSVMGCRYGRPPVIALGLPVAH